MEFKDTYFLKVYTGEDVLYDDIPLYKAILRKAHELGLAGGTVLQGIEGFATTTRGIGRKVNTLFSGNGNMPVIVEIVDNRENLEKLLPFLEKHATHALVLIEKCTYLVTDYIRDLEAAKLEKK